jgi:RNA polymerase sigma-70 factor, ECF subfamily
VSAKCVTFDECLIPDALIEGAATRLRAFASAAAGRSLPRTSLPGFLEHARSLQRRERPTPGHDLQDALVTELVARSRGGEDAAMELLVRQYQPRIAGFVFACVGDGQAVDDLCQTIFLKVLVRLRHLKEDGKFEAWLFRIARNACFDYLRRRRMRRIFVPWRAEADQFPAAPGAESDRPLEAFRRAIMHLPRKQRELIALLQDDQLSYEQLAAITNASVSSVKSRLFRARRQLRKSMQDEL